MTIVPISIRINDWRSHKRLELVRIKVAEEMKSDVSSVFPLGENR